MRSPRSWCSAPSSTAPRQRCAAGSAGARRRRRPRRPWPPAPRPRPCRCRRRARPSRRRGRTDRARPRRPGPGPAQLGRALIDRVQLAGDLGLELVVAGPRVLGQELGQPLLVGVELVGDVEQALELLALEPVGQEDRVVLELGHQLLVERAQLGAGAGRLLAGGIEQALLGAEQLGQAVAQVGDHLAPAPDRPADRRRTPPPASRPRRSARRARGATRRRGTSPSVTVRRLPSSPIRCSASSAWRARFCSWRSRGENTRSLNGRDSPRLGPSIDVVVDDLEVVADLRARRQRHLGQVPHRTPWARPGASARVAIGFLSTLPRRCPTPARPR